MVTSHQIVRHKSYLAKVKLDIILGQKLVALTLFAWACHNTTTTSKSYIQEILGDPNSFGIVYTFVTKSVIHHPSLIDHFQYQTNQCISGKIGDKEKPIKKDRS
jgi:uncharacterized integral membrane protein